MGGYWWTAPTAPPPAAITSPVTHSALGDARYAVSHASSSGATTLRIATFLPRLGVYLFARHALLRRLIVQSLVDGIRERQAGVYNVQRNPVLPELVGQGLGHVDYRRVAKPVNRGLARRDASDAYDSPPTSSRACGARPPLCF